MAALQLGTAPAPTQPVCRNSDDTGTAECRVGIPSSSNDCECVLNDDLFLGFDDWAYLSKQNVGDSDPSKNSPEGPIDIGLAVSPSAAKQIPEPGVSMQIPGTRRSSI